VEKINNDTLVLPTLPATALKVRKAADDPDVHLNVMADVIGQDPSLSVRMIKIANSAYMGRAVKVTSTSQAVNRIGLRKIKHIATALAMEQLFVPKNDIVKQYMERIWADNLKVVANAMAAMQLHIKETNNRDLNLDTMTLAALVHNIGVLPILTEAERHPDVFANPTFLNVAIDKLAGKIGSSILDKWGFEAELINVVENWRDLAVQTDSISYLDFTRLGITLAGQFDSRKDAVMNLSVQKGLFSDLNVLHSDEFTELRDSAMQIFV
ncbi:MAG: HD-like signal output (HDOD) protein, partial [Paraglaciecola sp.]